MEISATTAAIVTEVRDSIQRVRNTHRQVLMSFGLLTIIIIITDITILSTHSIHTVIIIISKDITKLLELVCNVIF